MDAQKPLAEAMLTFGDRIVGVGGLDEMRGGLKILNDLGDGADDLDLVIDTMREKGFEDDPVVGGKTVYAA